MVEDWEGNFQDPLYGAPGIQSQVVQASDQQAKAFKQALEGHVNSSYPNCPSCGIGIYHLNYAQGRLGTPENPGLKQ
jgi:hypothetical protein